MKCGPNIWGKMIIINVTNLLSSAEFAQRVVKVNLLSSQTENFPTETFYKCMWSDRLMFYWRFV